MGTLLPEQKQVLLARTRWAGELGGQLACLPHACLRVPSSLCGPPVALWRRQHRMTAFWENEETET